MLGSTNFSHETYTHKIMLDKNKTVHTQNIKILIIDENKRCETTRVSQTDHDHEKHMSK
jgi:hypothetical protein